MLLISEKTSSCVQIKHAKSRLNGLSLCSHQSGCVRAHSQGVVNPCDELNQEVRRHCQPRTYAFVASNLLPWVTAYTYPGGWQIIDTIKRFVLRASIKVNPRFHMIHTNRYRTNCTRADSTETKTRPDHWKIYWQVLTTLNRQAANCQGKIQS